MSHSLGDKDALMELEPGQVLDGRFVIHSLIGSGGQGRVYKLRHLEWNRDFALKLPLPKVVRSQRARELFLKEAEAWIRLGVHPNIVRCWFVRPVGELPGLFLDLMEGGSLGSKLKSKAVQPGQWDLILRVLLQVLEGLCQAHAKGMVHRDLKPENLMIHSDGRVCITDFGLVKTLDEAEPAEGLEEPLPVNSSVTVGAMGTPRYGAPEQWLNPGSVSTATDLYSLGCVMFELMCGRGPFETPGERTNSLGIIERHISVPPPDPRSICEDVPPEMAELCLHMLSKAPQQRPSSAESVLAQLTQLFNSRGQAAYQRPAAIPAGEHPDLLNNAAASLHSLGKTKKARELLLKGLMLEAGHPECLYNLIQLDRRQGKLGLEEAVRRLERAKAHFGLALLHIEVGQGNRAAWLLGRLPAEQKSGLLHRLEGDALMYAGEFDFAFSSYEKAAELMPNDLPTAFRKRLAERKTTRASGHVYFPQLSSYNRGRSHRPSVQLALSPDAEMLLALDESEVMGLCIHEKRVLKQAKRELYAGPVLWSDAHKSHLLIQDRSAFEIWSLDEFRMLNRMDGVVLARDDHLHRLLALTKDGLLLINLDQQQATQVALPANVELSPRLIAAFSHDGAGLGLLLPDGRLASLNSSAQLVPLSWPWVKKPDSVAQLCLGTSWVAVVHRSSHLHCFCLQSQTVSAEIELGFLPTSLDCDESGALIIASSDKAHLIMNKDGLVLAQGTGPCALEASKRRGVVWSDSRLRLYQMKPFQRLRTWEEEVPQPRRLQFSRDGRRALSQDETGEYRVWEVDEENRVFERNLLMTPGQSYSEIISSYQQYQADYQRAVQLFEEREFFRSYQTLTSARQVTGFHQAEEALELQWALARELQREGLEAIWERLFIPDTLSGELSPDSRYLLLAQQQNVELFEISGPRIESLLKLEPSYQPISAHYMEASSDVALIMVLGQDGELTFHRADTGDVHFETRLKTGRIAGVQYGARSALLQNTSSQVFHLDLSSAQMSGAIPLHGSPLVRAFLLDHEQALLVTHHRNLMADLSNNTSKPGLPAKLEDIQQQISFCKDSSDGKLRMTGFRDGTLAWSEAKTGRSLYSVEQKDGAVSASVVNLETALGVSVSEKGGITFFDLSAGVVLDRFIAHADGVTDLSITENGRYITTRSSSGQFRLWEMSWLLSERPGQCEIDWLPKSTLGKLTSFFRRG